MEWAGLIVTIGLLLFFFLSNGFKTRCPKCGAFGSHPKDENANAEQKQMWENMKQTDLADSLKGTIIAKQAEPGFQNDHLRCLSCSHIFSRDISITWHGVARKVGEEIALSEYKSLDSWRQK